MDKLYPLTFAPAYKDYLWGGDRIPTLFNRDDPPGIYAESWEVSDRPEGMSVVDQGPLAGRSLAALVAEYGEALVGRGRKADTFPLLIKIIDARQVLSIQVHPNDETAAKFGGEAKSEMWYLLDAGEGACVYSGFKPGVDAAKFRAALDDGTLESLVQRIPVQTGSAVYTPGGRIHAIGAGCLILEVQQNSNTTYRLYDFGRVGADGKPRELHIEQALNVIDWGNTGDPLCKPAELPAAEGNRREEVLNTPYFRMERLLLAGEQPMTLGGGSFVGLFVARGGLRVDWEGQSLLFGPGRSVLLPASVGAVVLAPEGEGTELLTYTLPG